MITSTQRLRPDEPLEEPVDKYDRFVLDIADETANYREARDALWGEGPKAVDALLRGLKHRRAKVRQTSVAVMDHLGENFESRCYPAILPLLKDDVPKVRKTAVHAIACQRCHLPPADIDVPALLIDMLNTDDSIAVRRGAIQALAEYYADTRVGGIAEKILASGERDADLRRWAENIGRRVKYKTPDRLR